MPAGRKAKTVGLSDRSGRYSLQMFGEVLSPLRRERTHVLELGHRARNALHMIDPGGDAVARPSDGR